MLGKIYELFFINNLFMDACLNNKLSEVKYLVENNYKINYNYTYTEVIVGPDVQSGIILNNTDFVENKIIRKFSGFSAACYNNSHSVVKYLLDKDLDINYNINLFMYKIPHKYILSLLIRTNKYINFKINNYDLLKSYDIDLEIYNFIKTNKFLNQNNKVLVLEIIKNIEVINIVKETKSHGRYKSDSCIICLEPLQKPIQNKKINLELAYQKSWGSKVAILPCGHEFCITCIKLMVDNHVFNPNNIGLECPYCRNKFHHKLMVLFGSYPEVHIINNNIPDKNFVIPERSFFEISNNFFCEKSKEALARIYTFWGPFNHRKQPQSQNCGFMTRESLRYTHNFFRTIFSGFSFKYYSGMEYDSGIDIKQNQLEYSNCYIKYKE
jgi:hypothetical protein